MNGVAQAQPSDVQHSARVACAELGFRWKEEEEAGDAGKENERYVVHNNSNR